MPKRNIKIGGAGTPEGVIAPVQTQSHGTSGKKMILTVIIIFVIFLLVVLGYFIYKHFTGAAIVGLKTEKVIPYIHDAKIPKKIANGAIPASSQGNEYNYNFWMYINDYTYKYHNDKSVMYKGVESEQTGANPSIWLLKRENTLRVSIGLQTRSDLDNARINSVISDSEDSNSDGCAASKTIGKNVGTCDIKNIPLQRWVNVNVALYNNVVDVYINGNLEKSCVLNGFPKINKGNLHISKEGGFNGYLANLRISNKTLPYSEVQKYYKAGPSLKAGIFG